MTFFEKMSKRFSARHWQDGTPFELFSNLFLPRKESKHWAANGVADGRFLQTAPDLQPFWG